MSISKTFSILFRKFPVFRALSILGVILFILLLVSLITHQAKKIPEIYSVNPPVGSPGDMMIITGTNFGETRNSSDYVEVGGSRITSSGYLEWSNSQIKLILPPNVQDGLVIVSTKSGNSKPSFFANEAGIPVQLPPDTKTSLPVITQITPESAAPGSLLVLNGTNFGTIRNNGIVFFTSALEKTSDPSEELTYVAASEDNYDYEYWSDSEIHIRLPDGAASGQIYVQTEKGKSNLTFLEVKTSIGTKNYGDKKTYLVHLNLDIDDISSKSNTSLALRVPRPPVTSFQPVSYMTECKPEPVFEAYQNTIIHQIELSRSTSKKLKFSHSFVIDDYSIISSINPKYVKPFADKERILFKTFTQPNALLKCEDSEYVSLSKEIIKKETNPYLQAKLIYEYLIDNYKLTNLRKNTADPKDLLKDRKGDQYDFAIAYATLLRSCKIPCVPVSGVLVNVDLKTQSHWWCEFYIENYGWVPVDIALGKGLEYKAFKVIENPREFYFGNIDSQHIIFSRGFNEVKPILTNSHSVYKERSFALQSIWEESTSGTVNYSSLWNEPVIAGIY